MGHTEERAHSNVRRGTLNKLWLVLAVSMAIGLGVSVASAATRCNPVLTPGENLARAAAHCPPSTTFIKKDGRSLHVINVRLHHNPNQGIGNPGPGFLRKNSKIDHNCSASFTNPSTASAAGV